MTLFIMLIPLPVEAKVKEEEKPSAVSVSSLFFCTYENIWIDSP